MKYIGMSVVLLEMFRLIFFIFCLVLLAHLLCHDPLRHRESFMLIDNLRDDEKVVHPYPGYVTHLCPGNFVCVCVHAWVHACVLACNSFSRHVHVCLNYAAITTLVWGIKVFHMHLHTCRYQVILYNLIYNMWLKYQLKNLIYSLLLS